ncbi:sensor histidine kinase [Nocardioides acrostichi]|uniref:histidine kinase n=1 Tax=Nocardioides acrostichi TaxID=2784339 RepID=A0A930Y9C6_9ACTN|nr:MASE4 domain-containing protein [Nocardioides acrostichi]MBF4163986.1 MASE4 domain-containing protein [Nocardioides acrostichi]
MGSRGDVRERTGTWTPWTVAGLLVLATAGLLLRAGLYVGVSPAFLPAFFTLVFACDMMTAAALGAQFRNGGSPRQLVVAAAYAWSTTIVAMQALVFPGVVTATGPLTNLPSSAPWLWTAWHVGFPLLLGLGLAPWPRGLHARLEATRHRGRLLLATFAVAVGAGLGVGLFAAYGAAHLPTIMVDGDYTTLTRVWGPWIVLVNVGSLVLGIAGTVRRRVRGLETWVVAALVSTNCDALLVLLARDRFTLGWYGARAMAVFASVVVLAAVLRESALLHRRLQGVAQTLRAQNDELREAQALREHLIAVVSHEMRTPLAGVHGYLEIVEEESDGLARDMLRRSLVLTRRLQLLSEDLLTVASRGRALSLQAEPVDVESALAECLRGFPDLAATSSASPGLRVQADPLRLQQILANLVRNAQKYGAQPITLSAESDAAAGVAHLKVTDAGEGIDPELAERLFTRYARGEGLGQHGSGLGLAVVKDLSEAMSGGASYDVAANVFRVTLPLASTVVSDEQSGGVTASRTTPLEPAEDALP